MSDSPFVGRTTLVRVPLSYKWIIDDAKLFLANRYNLKSPEFSLQVPSQVSSSFKNLVSSSWHLLCMGGRTDFFSQKKSLSLSLCQGVTVSSDLAQKRKRLDFEIMTNTMTVLVSDCVFTILHPETNEPLYSTMPSAEPPKIVVDKSLKTCLTVESIEYDDDKYLFNGTLTLQVKAVLATLY